MSFFDVHFRHDLRQSSDIAIVRKRTVIVEGDDQVHVVVRGFVGPDHDVVITLV